MGRKKKETSDSNSNKEVFARFRRIWEEVDRNQWHGFLSDERPDAKFTIQGGHIKGRCPFHDDATPSFIVTPKTGIAHCFGCMRTFHNPLAMVAAIRNTSFGEAISFARRRWGLKAIIPETLAARYTAYEDHQKMKNRLMEVFATLLGDAFEATVNGTINTNGALRFAQVAVDYLVNRRLGESAPTELVSVEDRPNGHIDQFGVWAAITGQRLMGVLPPKVVVEGLLGRDSPEFKFFTTYFEKVLDTPDQIGWLVFPYDDEPDSVCRFKLREPFKGPDRKPNQRWIDDIYDGELDGFRGFYGLRYYKAFLNRRDHGDNGPKDGHVAHVHEGEFDALAGIAQQVRRGSEDYIAVALGGGSAQSLERLKDYNILRVCVVQDNDSGGTNFVRSVLDKTRCRDMTIGIFQWPDECVNWRNPTDPEDRIKDSDEAIRQIGYPRWARYVCDLERFWKADEWCFEQANRAISRGSSSDVQFVSRVATEWGRLLVNEQLVSLYCQAIGKAYEIDANLLKRDLWTLDDQESTFVDRIARVLLDLFQVLGARVDGKKNMITMWHKGSRRHYDVVLNEEKSAENLIALTYGSIDDFMKTHVVEPGFIVPEPDENHAFNVLAKSAKYRQYLNHAFMKIVVGSEAIDPMNTREQGIHMVDSSQGYMLSYMVNGKDVYKIQHNESGMTTSKLEGPLDGKIMFNMRSGDRWCEFVDKVDDLTPGDVDLVDAFDTLRGMLDIGWGFRRQTVDPTFLAAYMMCLGVMTVFPRQTAIMVNAEHGSGKSKLCGGLLGGHEFPRMKVVAHSVSWQHYTAAAIRQKHNQTSLALCLAEFEDYGTNDPKSKKVRDVLELTRDMISESPVRVTQGSTGGDGRVFYLRFPMVCSAIHPLKDAASMSRYVTVEMVKDGARNSPEVVIMNAFGMDKIQRVKRDILLGALPHMLTLRQYYYEIQNEYSSGDKLPEYADSRFREALFPIMAMLRLLRELADAKKMADKVPVYGDFAYAFSESRKDHLTQLTVSTENERLFQVLLSAPMKVAVAGDRDHMSGTTNLRKMLSDFNSHDAINKTSVGVYFDAQNEWLIVNWIEVSQSLFMNTQFSAHSPITLKRLGDRSPHCVGVKEVRGARTMERMMPVMGPCQPWEMITVFSVRHVLDEVRRYMEQQAKERVGAAITEKVVDVSKPVDDDGMVV